MAIVARRRGFWSKSLRVEQKIQLFSTQREGELVTLAVAPLSTRNQFGSLLNQLGLVGRAAEIGTHRADFAKTFLDTWKGEKLFCVDHWQDYDQSSVLPDRGASRNDDYEAAINTLKDFGDRATILRATSPAVAADFLDETLDFVYIDGDHRTDAVLQDLRAWTPKVRTGGIVAGHDIISPGEDHTGQNWGPNVQKALAAFCAPETDLYLVVEEGGLPWSFYFFKK